MLDGTGVFPPLISKKDQSGKVGEGRGRSGKVGEGRGRSGTVGERSFFRSVAITPDKNFKVNESEAAGRNTIWVGWLMLH